jgi:putative Holliday junction resolvase
MRVMAVDPGEKRIGIAISDPTNTIANPLTVILHESRLIDSARINELAVEQGAGLIIVGQSIDEEGKATLEGRRAARLVKALRSQTDIPVILWDESFSTQEARSASIALGVPSRKRQRRGHHHLDAIAATVILQSYLDAHYHSP